MVQTAACTASRSTATPRQSASGGAAAAVSGLPARCHPRAAASLGPGPAPRSSTPSQRACSGPQRRGAGARPQRLVRQAAVTASAETGEETADFYELMGLSYTASTDEIKRAYRKLAKEFHPDISSDESSTDFYVFLNDVYETLSDPEKRAAYDSIVGYQVGGVNPFTDTSYERDMVFVDEFTCIGCKNCNNVCPATYMMEDEWGRARVKRQGVDGVEKLQESIDTCPVSCIHWVTAPQLACLEETMGRMERVSAWLLMSSGGKGANLNVFFESSLAWEKRQASLRAKVQAAKGWGSFWQQAPVGQAAGAAMQDAARQAAGTADGTGNSSLGRGKNAASVAAAARRWRDYQRAKRNKNQRLLTVTSSGSMASADLEA